MKATRGANNRKELIKLANILAEISVASSARRMRNYVMTKLAQQATSPPGQPLPPGSPSPSEQQPASPPPSGLSPGGNVLSRWMSENIYDPVSRSITGQIFSPEQKALANRILGGIGLGVAGGALLGGLAALRRPRHKRNIISQALMGSLLGATLGGAAGGGYHLLSSALAGRRPPAPPPPPGISSNLPTAVGQVVAGSIPAQLGDSNVAAQGLLANIARRQAQVAPASEVVKYLSTPDVHIPIDPEVARQLRAGGPAAIEAAARALTTQGGPGYFDVRRNEWVPFTAENIDVFRRAIESIPVEGGETAQSLAGLTTGHATADVLATLGAVDIAGRRLRRAVPTQAEQIRGLISSPVEEVIKEERKELGEAAMRGPRALEEKITEPLTDVQRRLARHRKQVQEAIAAGRMTPGELRVATAMERQLLDELQTAREQVAHRRRYARAAGRAQQEAAGGVGFAGTGRLRGRWGALPYVATVPLTYMMFDRPHAQIDTRIQNLYSPEMVEAARARGLIPQQ